MIVNRTTRLENFKKIQHTLLSVALLRARNGWLYCTLAEPINSKAFPENVICVMTQLVKSLLWIDLAKYSNTPDDKPTTSA